MSKKFRILHRTYSFDGSPYFLVQEKGWFLWRTWVTGDGEFFWHEHFKTREAALAAIANHIKSKNVTIEPVQYP
jgi:hypothetical protein